MAGWLVGKYNYNKDPVLQYELQQTKIWAVLGPQWTSFGPGDGSKASMGSTLLIKQLTF